jgi:hypothetical protein
MSEYIGEYIVSLTAKTFTDLRFHRHEEIVRCRDCEYYDDYTGCCTRRDNIAPMAATPDGFCAWGERREQ